MKYSPFTLTVCTRCESPVFRGWWSGFDLRLDHRTVPLRDAIVLDRYGVREVLVMKKRISGGLDGLEFVPRAEIEHYRNGDRRWYAVNHICGTRHDKWRRPHG